LPEREQQHTHTRQAPVCWQLKTHLQQSNVPLAPVHIQYTAIIMIATIKMLSRLKNHSERKKHTRLPMVDHINSSLKADSTRNIFEFSL
jgi:hypothetical protein